MSKEIARTGRKLSTVWHFSNAISTMHARCECISIALWQSVHCRVDGVQCWPFRPTISDCSAAQVTLEVLVKSKQLRAARVPTNAQRERLAQVAQLASVLQTLAPNT